VKRTMSRGSFIQAAYTGLDVQADAVTQLSKYVLDYAPHGVAVAASIDTPGPCEWRLVSNTSTHAIDRDERLCVVRPSHQPLIRPLRSSPRRHQSRKRKLPGDCRRRNARPSSQRLSSGSPLIGADVLRLSCRFLLGEAVNRAEPPREIHRMDSDHFVRRHEIGERVERNTVVGSLKVGTRRRRSQCRSWRSSPADGSLP